MRINKFIASCGLASRRKSEEFILSGKVKINGEIQKSLSFNVDENNDVVEVDGKIISLSEKNVYLMLHKPKGFLCTSFDSKGRKTIFDLIKGYDKLRLFSVGRLDRDTEGLLLLTNDGDLANKLIHPKFEIEKKYIVKIEGVISRLELQKLCNGVILDDGFKTAKSQCKLLAFENGQSRIEIIIHEGKNRQVRRMFEAINKNVVFLKRVEFAGLCLGGLGRGLIRELKKSEINDLKKL